MQFNITSWLAISSTPRCARKSSLPVASQTQYSRSSRALYCINEFTLRNSQPLLWELRSRARVAILFSTIDICLPLAAPQAIVFHRTDLSQTRLSWRDLYMYLSGYCAARLPEPSDKRCPVDSGFTQSVQHCNLAIKVPVD